MVIDKEIVETQTWKVWVDSDGIVHFVIQPHAHLGYDETSLLTQTYTGITGHGQNLILGEISGIKSASKEARDYASSPVVVQAIKAIALITRSPVSRVIGNFYVGINKPPYPARLFTSEPDAIVWLKEFIEL